MPLDRLLVETDSPVLGAVPGGRNEPAAGVIAGVTGLGLDEVVERLADNTRRLYGKGPDGRPS